MTNFNRRRNIFTLGEFHSQPHPVQSLKAQSNRRQTCDLFERDPFKVQSYNFRYADRPAFPVQGAQHPASSSNAKRFDTFFYNYDFPTSRADKENSAHNSQRFHERRRRTFLQDQMNSIHLNSRPNRTDQTSRDSGVMRHNVASTSLTNATPTQTPLYRSSNHALPPTTPFAGRGSSSRVFLAGTQRRVSNERITSKDSVTALPGPAKKSVSSTAFRQSQAKPLQSSERTGRKRSLSSGCEININIKGFDEDLLGDNVTIKIESDAASRNENPPRITVNRSNSINNNMSSHIMTSVKKSNIEPIRSSDTFIIDKYTSPFALEVNSDNRQENLTRKDMARSRIYERERERIRQRDLNSERESRRRREEAVRSVYGTNLLSSGPNRTTRTCPSIERMPSLVPWRLNNGGQRSGKENNPPQPPTQSRNPNRRPLSNYKPPAQDPKRREGRAEKVLNTECGSWRALKRSTVAPYSPYQTNGERRQMISSTRAIPANSLRSELKPVAPLLYGSHSNITRSPLSVNINVYADHLKLLRV